MNRRTVLAKGVLGAISAAVFSATGWLMGTKTLTMEPGTGTWSPYFVFEDCPAGAANCSCGCGPGQYTSACHYYAACSGEPSYRCFQEDTQTCHCCNEGPDLPCKVKTRAWPCGSCSPCSP